MGPDADDQTPETPGAHGSGTPRRKRRPIDSARLQAFASWAEVASAVAVVLSLVYLATEVRRSSTMDSRDADIVLFERIADAQRMIIQTPGLAETIATAEQRADELSPADRLRYLALQDHFYNSWEMGWYYHTDGILSDVAWTEWDEWFSAEARRRPALAWLGNRHNYTYQTSGSEFQRHVDSILSP